MHKIINIIYLNKTQMSSKLFENLRNEKISFYVFIQSI